VVAVERLAAGEESEVHGREGADAQGVAPGARSSPTLTLLLTAGALARTGHISLPLIIAVAAGAVVAGDFLAHRTGRFLADRLRTGWASRRVPPAVWARAEALMARHGGRAVFLARFIPVVRTLAPTARAPPICPTTASRRTASPRPASGRPQRHPPDTRPPPPSSTCLPWRAPPRQYSS